MIDDALTCLRLDSTSSTTSTDIGCTTAKTTSTSSPRTENSSDKYPFRLLALLNLYGIDVSEAYDVSKYANDINNLENKLATDSHEFFHGSTTENKCFGNRLYTCDKSIKDSILQKSILDNGYYEFSQTQLIWQVDIRILEGDIVTKFLPPKEKTGSCIFYKLVGSDRFLECKIYYNNFNDSKWKHLLDNGIEFGGRKYYFLCGERPKTKKKDDKSNYFDAKFFSHDWNHYSFNLDKEAHFFNNNDAITDDTLNVCYLGDSNSHLYQPVDQLISQFAAFEPDDLSKRNIRLQLGFSPCSAFILCDEASIEVKPDIANENIMTDGCGLISSSFFKTSLQIPQVIQIRASTKCGLFKGILIVTDDINLCPNDKIYMRQSMLKANGSKTRRYNGKAHIFIKNTFQYEKFHWGMTNHESIQLLQHCGIPGVVFTDLLNREIENIPILCEPKKLLKSLRKLNYRDDDEDSDDKSYSDYIDNAKRLIELLESYHDPKTEAYVKLLLEKVQISQYKKLVSLKVPFYNRDAQIYSTNLVGVADPTGTLEVNEVFISMNFIVSNEGSGTQSDGTLTDDDEIIVSRYPIGHPGDLRKMKVRNTTELQKFAAGKKGCVIFFSTKGVRSAADMMGGGDYDGDTFIIIYGANRIVQSFKQCDPYNYGSSSHQSITSNISRLDLVKTLTVPPIIGIFANKRKHFTEFKGALAKETVDCHKITSDALEKKSNSNNSILIGKINAIKIETPSYEITIDDIITKFKIVDGDELKKPKFGLKDGNGSIKQFSRSERTILAKMHETVLDRYFQTSEAKDYSFTVNTNLLPKSYDNPTAIDKYYYEKWEGYYRDYINVFKMDKKYESFQNKIKELKLEFIADSKELAKKYDELLGEKVSVDTYRFARASLAKIIYYVTYKKYLNSEFPKSKKPSVTFCWWVCFEDLNAIQFTVMTCNKTPL